MTGTITIVVLLQPAVSLAWADEQQQGRQRGTTKKTDSDEGN